MNDELVLVERDAGITTVTLNRPEALNALSSGLRRAITQTFRVLQDDASTEVVILTGAGRAFTVGLDLKELGGERAPDAAATAADLNILAAIEAFDRPVIGAINGYAITGGFELALMCDLLIVSTQARFADTHARVGVVPGWGLSQKLPRLIGVMRAKELSLTGNFLDAQQAYDWGLVNRVVSPDDLLRVCRTLAHDMLSTDRATRLAMLRVIDQGWNATLGEGMIIEADASRAHFATDVRADKIAARRGAIQNRGRGQNRAPGDGAG